jgi:hypothetical protein
MNGKICLLAGGLAAVLVIAFLPLLLQATNNKSEPYSLNGWVDNSQAQIGLVTQQMGRMPLAFTKNRGQWDGQALFRANAGGAIPVCVGIGYFLLK